MTKLPEKDLLSGNKMPRTTTGEMKTALGKLRDFLAELFGDDSANKEATRMSLGIDLSSLASKSETETALSAKADKAGIEEVLSHKADKEELTALEQEIAKRGTPVGSIEFFAMVTPPTGYLKADGSVVGRETYPDLFAAIGTTFGMGDEETTFNLPDLMDRFAQGSQTPGQKLAPGVPNIKANMDDMSWGIYTNLSGAYCTNGRKSSDGAAYGSNGYRMALDFDASLYNPIYGASDTVQPPSLTLLPCIKAFDAATNPGLIDITGLAQETAGKIDKTIDGIVVKYVTETFNDGINWYRKWSDGWLEQGGMNKTSTSGNVTITFLKPYQSIPRVMAFGLEASPTTSWWMSGARTPTSLYVAGSVTGYQLEFDWYACGY